jgi:8-oxo-dGTP pyrophosphatase MutT (NUDIX family)
MKIEINWMHEYCDAECYNEIFFGGNAKYKDVDIFSRILPFEDKEYRFIAHVMLVRGDKNFSVQKRVNTFKEGMDWADFTVSRNISEFSNEQDYVLGFVKVKDFKVLKPKVLLMIKQRPEYQKGKLNGIGGKIEAGETPIKAMIREFGEEVTPNLLDKEEHWNNFYNFSFENEESKQTGKVYCFRSVLIVERERLEDVLKNPPTNEKLVVVDYEDIILGRVESLKNLPMIVQAMFHYPMDPKDWPPVEAWH